MSRILSGAQEPKLRLAYDLARVLGVTLDYLVDDDLPADPSATQWVAVTEDELALLKVARRLGTDEAIDRLVGRSSPETASRRARPANRAGSS